MNVTEITSIRASAVPSVPKTITPSQPLAALELAQRLEEYAQLYAGSAYGFKILSESYSMLRELAADAKVPL